MLESIKSERGRIEGNITPCTLLIPEEYVALFRQRLDYHDNGPAQYFRYLLKFYRNALFNGNATIQSLNGIKCRYQTHATGYVRIPFRPSRFDWLALTHLSRLFGYSRCYIFVLLLKMEAGVEGETVVVPTTRVYTMATYKYFYKEFFDPETEIYIKKLTRRIQSPLAEFLLYKQKAKLKPATDQNN